MAVVKTSISLMDDVYNFGLEKANRRFGGKFSTYVNYLISCDREHRETPAPKKDNVLLSAIEQILDM